MRDGDEDRQQQAERAELDRADISAGVLKVQVRGIQRQARGNRSRERRRTTRRARSGGVAPQQPRQEGEPESPGCEREERTRDQQRRAADADRRASALARRASRGRPGGSDGGAAPAGSSSGETPSAGSRRMKGGSTRYCITIACSHPAWTGGCGNPRRCHTRIDEPQRPAKHRQQHVGGAGEEQQPMRRGGEQRRRHRQGARCAAAPVQLHRRVLADRNDGQCPCASVWIRAMVDAGRSRALTQVKRANQLWRIGAASACEAAISASSTSRRSTTSRPSSWKRFSTRLTVSGARRR